jgi:hypothetical protein
LLWKEINRRGIEPRELIKNWILNKFHFTKNNEIEVSSEIANFIFDEIKTELYIYKTEGDV